MNVEIINEKDEIISIDDENEIFNEEQDIKYDNRKDNRNL